MRLGPTFRISISLTLLTVSVLLLADMLGFVPDRLDLEMENRKIQAEMLAVQLSLDAGKRTTVQITPILESLVSRNDTILSAAMRRADGSLLAAGGDHPRHWRPPTAEHSSIDHIQVPIFQGKQRWGTVEVSYTPIRPAGTDLLLESSIFRLAVFIGLGAFLAYLLFMRRTLKILNPSSVIPQRVQAALDVLSEGVLILDENECIVLANASFARHCDQSSTDLIGRNAADLGWSRLTQDDEDRPWPWSVGTGDHDHATGVALVLTTAAGARRTFMVNAAAITDGKGGRRGTLATFDDVTQLESTNGELTVALEELQESQKEISRQNRELKMLATVDSLTGALNRRAFFQRFKPAFREAQESGSPLTCIMLDIDHFKSVNDRYGHAAGDRVIRRVAEILADHVRPSDLVGRYGGEEFAVVLPGLEVSQAESVGERLRASIGELVGTEVGEDVTITSSFGVAGIDSGAKTADELLDFADKALYVAKECGRNRLVRWSEHALARDLPAMPVPADEQAQGAAPANDSEILRLKQRIQSLQMSANDTEAPAVDAITDLPNHSVFLERIDEAIQQARRYERFVAMLVIDLRMVRHTGDQMDQVYNDALILRASERLQSILRSTDSVGMLEPGNSPRLYRMSTEEFGVLLSDLADVEAVTLVVKRLLDALAIPLDIDGDRIFVTSTVGISLYPHDGHDAAVLLRNARTARNHARRQGRYYHFQFYAEQMNAASSRQIRLETLLPRALDNDELSLHYQPKVDLVTGQITGLEALLRWTSPELGNVSPAEFIPIAEHTGLINPIGDWVMDTAVEQVARWVDSGLSNARVAINLSAAQFRNGDIEERIAEVLARHDVAPDRVEFELTESLIMENTEATIATMHALHALGVRMAIDDFGTGHSSLGYLKTFPIHAVKIDRSFLQDVETGEADRALVAGIIAMSHSLGLRVIAEGVETPEQLDFLRQAKCDELQGFLFSRPVPTKRASRLLHTGMRLSTAVGVPG